MDGSSKLLDDLVLKMLLHDAVVAVEPCTKALHKQLPGQMCSALQNNVQPYRRRSTDA